MFKSEAIRAAYEARRERYFTAMGCGTPDRVPIRFFLQEAAARMCGKTNQDVALDYNLAFECTRKAGEELCCDAMMLNAIWSTYSVAKAAAWKYLHVPGVDTTMENVLQFSEPPTEEEAFLRFDEYEEFADDPTAFLLNKWFARNSRDVVPTGSPVTLDHNANLLRGALAFANYMNAWGPAADKLKYESGIVSANAGMIKAPLDILMDKFRGYQNTVCDCLEDPDRVRKTCEALIPHIVQNAINGADPTKQVPITIWAHRGCVPFITPKIFDTIYWPTLKPVFEEIISRGYRILFYSEGNWEKHYDTLHTLPAGSLIYHLTAGSPETAARKLKDKFAISGGLDYNILVQGNQADVEAHMKNLFNWLKPDGGYMLDGTSLLLSDVNPDNLRTAVRYTLDHGGYSRSTPGKPVEACAPTNPAPGKRAPNTVRSWETESAGYSRLRGDVDTMRAKWQGVDAALYSYLWTTVLW
ncbi:MAG: hypothetical protein MJ249_01655 [Kiritimatiellae bacterium]|nr:hypothetical protein [Kiritimatiellia bacterium]